MRNPIWQRLAAGTAFAALLTAVTVAAVELVPPRAARADAADLFNPATLALSRCTGASAAYMRVFSQIGMARLASLTGLSKAKLKPDVPLWQDLGTHTYSVTTKEPLAQAYFDQGLRLSFGFNHMEAVRAFRQAQALDPKCAMCFWGEAYALGPNINLDMQADAVAPAFAAITKAKALASKASAKEQALIAAMAARYTEIPPKDRTNLNKAYATAMAGIAKTYPDDADILTLYAEALMDIHPWDYWKAGGTEPNDDEGPLQATLERAMKLAPDHPGALHFYIHAMEATPSAKLAEAASDRLEPLMPGAGHLVHMPGHIYMRIGRQADSIKANLQAIEADEKFIAARGGPEAAGFYALAYYPHNVHFVLVSAQLGGDTETVRAMAKKLDPLVPSAILKDVFIAQPVKTAALIALAQIGDADSVMAAEKPANDLPYVLDMWHYARALVMARKGDSKAASAELAEMKKISASKALEGYPQVYLPAAGLGAIAEEIVSGRIAEIQGKPNTAIAHFRKAADLQAALPYTEPPFWYYPIKQSLGGLLLANGKAKEASAVFRASLLDQPGNAYAIYGLMKSYEAMGDQLAAAETKKHFAAAWLGKTETIDLKWM